MSAPENAALLIEVGCEEIPDRMLDAGSAGFAAAVVEVLRASRLILDGDRPQSRAYSSPRRLAVLVQDVLCRQPDETVRVTGPPVRAAFDEGGAPTRAALGFAASQGVGVEQLERVRGAKGEVVAVTSNVTGRPLAEVLAAKLQTAVLALVFPKSMGWGAGGIEFVRPIRWVVALHGHELLPLEIAGVEAGRKTYARRGAALQPVRLEAAGGYERQLLGLEVVVDPAVRRARVAQAITDSGAEAGGQVVADEGLESIVSNLVEYPGCLYGSFSHEFLELPDEVLTTTLRHHQRCFSVADEERKLLARFVAVVNVPEDRTGAIRRGYEWVIDGRLSDARFFYLEDRKRALEERLELLERTRFHADLGSFAAKSARLEGLVRRLAALAGLDDEVAGRAARAARLSKCDLASQMENEFPELQGIVGGLYAREEGAPEGVWQAIYDHYRPEGMDDALPRGAEGALLSVADRLDTLVGLMGVGIVPKGSRDPFALRRTAAGLVRILAEAPLSLSFRAAVDATLAEYDKSDWRVTTEDLVDRVTAFVEARLRYGFEQGGHRYDSISAVLAAGWDNPALAAARLAALTSIRGEDDFEALAVASKRIRNILVQAKEKQGVAPGRLVDEQAFVDDAERQLHHAATVVAAQVEAADGKHEHRAALLAIASLRPHVDRFFDRVMVLAEDPAQRANRLALLANIAALYADRADFAEIVVEGKA